MTAAMGLRYVLLVVGFLIVVMGAALKYRKPDLEVTPLALIGFGALCVVVATNGVDA